MSHLRARSFRDADDLKLLVEVLNVARPPERHLDFPSAADLAEALAQPTTQQALRLWCEVAGPPVAFAYVDPYNNLVFEVADAHRSCTLEDDLVAHGLALMYRRNARTGASETLDANCRSDDSWRLALLARHDFKRDGTQTLVMACALTTAPFYAPLPLGYAIEPFAGTKELDALLALHQAAFGTSNMTREERLAIMSSPAYLPELDLVVRAPDGSLAGYLTCSTEPNPGGGPDIGFTDPVAVLPEQQRRGLAKALLAAGLAGLHAYGVREARLGTTNHNAAMQRAARVAGFKVTERKLWFTKRLGVSTE